jgi:hypothetical protein
MNATGLFVFVTVHIAAFMSIDGIKRDTGIFIFVVYAIHFAFLVTSHCAGCVLALRSLIDYAELDIWGPISLDA